MSITDNVNWDVKQTQLVEQQNQFSVAPIIHLKLFSENRIFHDFCVYLKQWQSEGPFKLIFNLGTRIRISILILLRSPMWFNMKSLLPLSSSLLGD